jgi:hypothetical protein
LCCHNNYVVKNSENDLEIFKKDVSNKAKFGRNRKITEYEEEEENFKYKRNKELLDKHMKDNSFKLNTSTTKAEIFDRIAKLEEIVKSAHTLSLKVITHSHIH